MSESARHVVDLRSDTVTRPTPEMYDAMAGARLGDDNIRDDPTIFELEALAAEVTGHEAALFCPTGTMANLLGTRSYCRHGDGVALPRELNMHRYGVIAWNGLQPFLADWRDDGYPTIDELARVIDWGLPSETPLRLVVVETPHNNAGGCVASPEYFARVRDLAHRHGLAFYLDGARVFNAAVALGVPARELTSKADLTMFSLSKGLSCPAGSVLCGQRDLIARAVKTRFLMGGAMRQAGLLAACGIYALNNLVERLAEDHANARLLASAVGRWPGIRIDHRVETNMVYLDVAGAGLTPAAFCERLAAADVLGGAMEDTRVRLVVHRGIGRADVERVVEAIDTVVRVAA